MQIVQTQMALLHARAMMGTLEMGSIASVRKQLYLFILIQLSITIDHF